MGMASGTLIYVPSFQSSQFDNSRTMRSMQRVTNIDRKHTENRLDGLG